MRLYIIFAAMVLWVGTGLAQLLPFDRPYIEHGGRVVGEGERYHATEAKLGKQWTIIESTQPGAYANARGNRYVQVLPHTINTGILNFEGVNGGPTIDYRIAITNAGVYRLWLRWDGHDFDSDSIYAGILELADGPGGVPDWYQDSDHRAANFASEPWDGLGGAEQNQPTSSQNPMVWTINDPGIYTLRVVPREDGTSLDSWILQLDSLPAPAGFGFPALFDDEVVMHHHSKVSIPALNNDIGPIDMTTLELVDLPEYGTATILPGGRILYEHLSGSPAQDSFTYLARHQPDASPAPAPARVTIEFSGDLRIPNKTISMPAAPPPTTYSIVETFPGITFTSPTAMAKPPGETNRLFITQRNGQVYVINGAGTASPQKVLFMDISSRVDEFGFNELGMKGIAFHPGFATNRYFYLTYCHWDGSNRRVRLSRFEMDENNPNIGNPNSEFILINQINKSDVHNINGIHFGADDYMYVSIGDEGFSGSTADGYNNSQVINSNIWSAILRIDVDKRPGNLEPNSHAGIPLDGGTARFSIPADNPFIGTTQFNGIAVNPAQVRTEFYVVGIRNAWNFSFDQLTGDFWVADVGNDLWEKVSIMPPGSNGGWVFYEGTHPGPRPNRQPPDGFEFVQPVWEYGASVVPGRRAIIGGFVYRGNSYPDLYGKYICSDYVSGDMWTIERKVGITNVVRIAGEGAVVQYGLHPARDEIIMLDIGDGRVRSLTIQGQTNAFPATLTETGFFAELDSLSPNPGVIAYEPNLSFWSDHAVKRRWFALTNVTDVVEYVRDGHWLFPAGMMWVKHFDLAMERGNPDTKRRIETRVLVKTPAAAYGVSYQWNEDETEAYLVPDAGATFNLSITNNETPVVQEWRIPSRAECMICHTPGGGHALSFNTRQLNAPGEIAGASGNCISLLKVAGYIGNDIDDPATLPRHIRPDETEYSLEVRSRSYLEVNCGYCHMGAQSTVPGNWDGRTFVRLDDTGMLYGLASGGGTNHFLIVPADADHSVIWNRMAATNGFTRMPPLATSELDPVNIQLVAEWINGDLASRQSYMEWQIAHFGSTTNVLAAPDADPDEDGRTNREEFLAYTDPLDPGSYWVGIVSVTEDGELEVGHDLFNRRVVIEKSTNLQEWSRWNVPANNGI
ncbi:MAG TPA: PQQ-dependent sugar dehydrogenase, partial [Kiritimatiellia bacterium]|nr:PQQ-dependent sugar dehydrogenase [Kiritimatiellia bacterium]